MDMYIQIIMAANIPGAGVWGRLGTGIISVMSYRGSALCIVSSQ